ncbi:hypothetical protein AB0D37_06830 [Streptomyces sp. NPDC048384]|uniref:hypothetical protein n=1 Tax=Streptomyces sp. NPDC048384 TaxID=3155487 RepID=UPI0034278F32
MRACTTVPLAVRIPGQETPRLNLLCPLYGRTPRGRKRADFTRAAKQSIQMIDRKVTA